MISRETVVLDAYMPTLVVLCVLGTLLTWAADRLLARVGLYRFVWHPSLFRAALLICLCGGLGLAVYH
jgi:protein AaeX